MSPFIVPVAFLELSSHHFCSIFNFLASESTSSRILTQIWRCDPQTRKNILHFIGVPSLIIRLSSFIYLSSNSMILIFPYRWTDISCAFYYLSIICGTFVLFQFSSYCEIRRNEYGWSNIYGVNVKYFGQLQRNGVVGSYDRCIYIFENLSHWL